MSEKNYETSELKELKDVLQTFTEFVWEMEEYLPEFYHFFDTMRQNIEIFLRVGEEDEEQIHEILERDWEKAHAPLVGVQCYDFQGITSGGRSRNLCLFCESFDRNRSVF
ncbi:MAG: hypothetical protein ACLR4N_08110 [Mediterraneibacter faecis]